MHKIAYFIHQFVVPLIFKYLIGAKNMGIRLTPVCPSLRMVVAEHPAYVVKTLVYP